MDKCKCGNEFSIEKDFTYDIYYYICKKCGSVKFDDSDGLGMRLFHLPSKERVYYLYCEVCKKKFKSLSPNKPVCPKCKGERNGKV